MEEQNRVNEEKDRNTQRQETKVATERVKVDKGAIRKMETQREIVTNPKPTKEKDTQRKLTKEKNIKSKNTYSVLPEVR